MITDTVFRPDWASPPGDTIKEILEVRGMSVQEFAGQLGRSIEWTNDLLQGKEMITIATARRLEDLFGASMEFWMNRDYDYQKERLDKESEDK